MKSANYRHNHKEHTATLTEKASKFEKINIKGVLWFDGSNTYHKAYISGIDKESDSWVEIGETIITTGYGDHYNVTAGDWLIANGYLTADSGYALGYRGTREALGIENYSMQVRRKRDL